VARELYQMRVHGFAILDFDDVRSKDLAAEQARTVSRPSNWPHHMVIGTRSDSNFRTPATGSFGIEHLSEIRTEKE